MTNKEALEVFRKSDACYGDKCPDGVDCANCPNNNTEDEFLDAMDLAKKTLEDTIPKFHLKCLRCKGDVGVYSIHTMEQVSYTHYSYCEDCLRKGLKLLRADKQDMRNPADRWEPKEVKNSKESSITRKGLDTISRQAALDVIRPLQTYKLFEGDEMLLVEKAEVQTELMMLPSAQPEIIRCKDCKYYKAYDYTGYLACHYVIGGTVRRNLDDFCSRGERREE